MSKRVSGWRGHVFLLVALLVCPGAAWAGSITVGSISVDPADDFAEFAPLAAYLAKQLPSDGVDRGRVVVADGIPQMARYLREGKVDLYIDSPFPSMAVSRAAGSRFLLRRWKRGQSEYHSVIFVREDSGIGRLEDLKGKVIAFEEPFSSSGYFLPKVTLAQKGFTLVPKREASDPVAPDEVGYVFSYDDEDTMVWVLRRKVAAGATDDQTYVKKAKGSLGSLRVIYRTPSVARQIVSCRSDLPPALVAHVKRILLEMERTAEGRSVLRAFEKTTRFDEIPDPDLASLAELQRFVDAEVGRR